MLNSGSLMIGEQSSTLAALTGDLCATISNDSTNERVFLRAEPDVDYRQFMAVMNTLDADSLHQIGLLNEDIQ